MLLQLSYLIPNCHRAEWAHYFYQKDDHNRSNDKGRICVITTNDVSCGVDMPSFITIALVIDKDCNTPGTGSAVNMQ